MTVCLECKRPLTDPVSIERRMGPVCYGKVSAEEEKGEGSRDRIAKLPRNPETKDVVCSRSINDEFDVKFNIPHSLIIHSPTGMEFGYSGSGPADYAANILYWFTKDETFARAHHQEFKFSFVSGLPREGGTISGDEIEAWIAERRNDLCLVGDEK